MAAFLSAAHLLQNPDRTVEKPGSAGQLAPRIGLIDVERSRKARHRLRVLMSAQKLAACFEHRADGGLLAVH